MIVPTLCVGMQPVTLLVTRVPGSTPVVLLERGASLEAFPRRAWEQSVVGLFEPQLTPAFIHGDGHGIRQVQAAATFAHGQAQALFAGQGIEHFGW